LIEGIPFAMNPLPAPKHQIVAGILFAIFKPVLKDKCNACRGIPPIDWKVREDTVLQPDFLVVCGPPLGDGPLTFAPALVAEILSPSTVIKDRDNKFCIYEREKVKYYLIINVDKKKMEIFELINDKYQLVSETPPSFDFTLHNNCPITVPFHELWD